MHQTLKSKPPTSGALADSIIQFPGNEPVAQAKQAAEFFCQHVLQHDLVRLKSPTNLFEVPVLFSRSLTLNLENSQAPYGFFQR